MTYFSNYHLKCSQLNTSVCNVIKSFLVLLLVIPRSSVGWLPLPPN